MGETTYQRVQDFFNSGILGGTSTDLFGIPPSEENLFRQGTSLERGVVES